MKGEERKERSNWRNEIIWTISERERNERRMEGREEGGGGGEWR